MWWNKLELFIKPMTYGAKEVDKYPILLYYLTLHKQIGTIFFLFLLLDKWFNHPFLLLKQINSIEYRKRYVQRYTFIQTPHFIMSW